ncbi:hypothetical protein MPLDJ20_310017 [Mesorhizobium plurifarium]|uniref:Uncharacterized protein n=1 Tax=Mesorhizobium plurifarium TaxID=69974 RepID=A0A090FAJ4_MESPL|nr:hypothetical protein MPLDJ20_310017 [Mesorhizobium plurifarium]
MFIAAGFFHIAFSMSGAFRFGGT